MSRLLLLLLLFALSPVATSAQEPGWPVEQRCVSKPTPPPPGWTFPGTLLLHGRYGIHAVDAKHETPYVAVYLQDDGLPGGGKLSPDGRWYAMLEGSASYGQYAMNAAISVSQIQVWSTVTNKQHYKLAWQNAYSMGSHGLDHELWWYDNTHLLYEADGDGQPHSHYLINPFEGTSEPFNNQIVVGNYLFYPSPDWTRAIYPRNLDFNTDWVLRDRSGEKRLFPASEADSPMAIYWTTDSTQFINIIYWKDHHELALYDTNGNRLDTLTQFQQLQQSADEASWSPDGAHFAFLASQNLMIADLKAKRIIDYCISGSGLIWSHDSTKIAFMGNSLKEQRPIRVLDLEREQVYTVAYHSGGGIIGWRAD
jgi:hypothetical protein